MRHTPLFAAAVLALSMSAADAADAADASLARRARADR